MVTPEQLIALKRVASGDCHPHGNNVRCVRVCSELGLCTLEDLGGIHDRYYAELTDKGREYIRKNP